jgi:hypothetical protein
MRFGGFPPLRERSNRPVQTVIIGSERRRFLPIHRLHLVSSALSEASEWRMFTFA